MPDLTSPLGVEAIPPVTEPAVVPPENAESAERVRRLAARSKRCRSLEETADG